MLCSDETFDLYMTASLGDFESFIRMSAASATEVPSVNSYASATQPGEYYIEMPVLHVPAPRVIHAVPQSQIRLIVECWHSMVPIVQVRMSL
jgi:hypothetical protein